MWLLVAVFMSLAARSGVAAERVAPPPHQVKGSWDFASLPAEVRDRMHRTAGEVPAFPNEEPKLLDLKNWPKYRVFEGRKCQLEVHRADVLPRGRPPRPEYTTQIWASYECKPWLWRKAESLGPSYYWTSDGQLLERAYSRTGRRGTAVRIYQIDRAGRFVGYLDRIHGTEEYFDADGSLIAGEYGRVSLWMGERVSHVEYAARRRRLFRDVRWRY